MNRGKPNWEHLKEPLHVLITVEDTENRACVKIERAKEEVKKLLVPSVRFFSVYNKLICVPSYIIMCNLLPIHNCLIYH